MHGNGEYGYGSGDERKVIVPSFVAGHPILGDRHFDFSTPSSVAAATSSRVVQTLSSCHGHARSCRVTN
eukprot:scaffold13356_cov147-Amphora_coffeaeformis.AAC.1